VTDYVLILKIFKNLPFLWILIHLCYAKLIYLEFTLQSTVLNIE